MSDELRQHLEDYGRRAAQQFNSRDRLFERLSRNIKSWPSSFTYENDLIVKIEYTKGEEKITKVLTYGPTELLESLTLSGYSIADPVSKIFSYDENENIVGYTYQ